MTLALMLVAAIGAVVLTERGAEHLPFAMAALFLNAALLLIFVADIERAVLLSGLLAIAIAAASIVKFKHSALKLSVADVPLMFPGTLPFFASQYPRLTSAVLAGAVFFVSASSAVLFYAAGSPLSVAFRILLVSLALIGVVVASAAKDSAASVRGSLTEPRCFYSTFMALTKMNAMSAKLCPPMGRSCCTLGLPEVAGLARLW
jgi:hypothetical protein